MRTILSGIHFLVISTETSFLRQIKNKLKEKEKAEVFLATSLLQAKQILETESLHVVLFDYDLASIDDALDFLNLFQEYSAGGLCYFYTKKPNYKEALEIIKAGATDFITQPIDWENLFQEMSKRLSSRFTQLVNIEPELQKLQYFLLFRSNKMKEGLKTLPRIAKTNYSVLIMGESGTGKEMVARAIHALSDRKEGAFVSVNCAAIPETLIESELFGYEKGSFTGATGVKKGKFELANKGTLLLDEIGDMPLQLQTRLLRVLEAGKVSRIGGERDITLDVRVIAATHNNLKQKIIDGLFREDLYYRLNILNIHLPPLRERKEDISLLAWNFLQRVLSEVKYKPPYPYLSQQSIQLLESHNWSGNVRELKNLMTQIAVLLPSGIRKIEAKMIKKALFQHVTRHSQNEEMFQAALTMSLEEVKNGYIQKILDSKKGNKTKAAKSLGISLRSLRQKTNAI